MVTSTSTVRTQKGGEIKGDDMNQYEALAAHGRGGDSDLALTSSREREMLRRMGGSGTINLTPVSANIKVMIHP